MNASSISRRLIAFTSACFGFVRGGLSMVTIGASMFFAEISGSAVAGVAALGTILIPAMRSRGYSKEFAISSSSASLAIIIPPSIPDDSLRGDGADLGGEMFVAGILPGILGAAVSRSRPISRRCAHDFPVEEKFQLARMWVTLKEASWAFLLPVIILGGIFGGFVTATEGAGLAVVAVLLLTGGVIYHT